MHIMHFDLVRSRGEAIHQLDAFLTGRAPGTKDFNVAFLLHLMLVPFSMA
jgi:hypothetical protein